VDLDHEALRAACFEAARKTMEDARPTDVDKIRRLADIFYHFARAHVSRIRELGRDPEILVRAVAYLARTHALSQMHDSTEWFFFMLRALLELACPDRRQPAENIGFLADVEEGIRLVRRDAGTADQS
jgi:hypothetical protein